MRSKYPWRWSWKLWGSPRAEHARLELWGAHDADVLKMIGTNAERRTIKRGILMKDPFYHYIKPTTTSGDKCPY